MTTRLQVEKPDAVDSCADTVRIRVLAESAVQQSDSQVPVPSFDPYSTGIAALSVRPRSRRTLDDMRRLSEAILRSRRAAAK